MNDGFNLKTHGRVKIYDVETGKLIFDKCNAIDPQNMATTIARGLARDANGYIFTLCFGNGGTFYNSSNQIVYRPPNTIGSANLYNLTYQVQVDEQTAGTPSTNSVVSTASPSPAITSIVTVTAQLNTNEPSGQALADNLTTNPTSTYTFDEMGLKTPDGLLLSHLVFSPIEKTANRAFLIIYTLTLSAS